MSITTEIQRLNKAKLDIKNSIERKGVLVGGGRINEYSNKIDQIQTGIKPVGSITITQNGTYDVTEKAQAIVDVKSKPIYPIIEGSGDIEVRFIDYDGMILKIQRLNKGQNATPPPLPDHERLRFKEWNLPYTNVQHIMEIGAVYTTKTNRNEAFITLTPKTGLTIDISLYNRVDGNTVNINWGDGSAPINHSYRGAVNKSHTYPKYGDYMISIGTSYGLRLGISGTSTSFIREPGKSIFSALKKLYLMDQVNEISQYGLSNQTGLEELTLCKVTGLYISSITHTQLEGLVFPSSLTRTDARCLVYNNRLQRLSLNKNLTSLGNPMIVGSHVERYIQDKNQSSSLSYFVNISGTKLLYYNKPTYDYYLSYSFGAYAIGLKNFPIYNNMTRIDYGAFQYAGLIKMKIPPRCSQIANYAFSNCIGLSDIYCYPTTPPKLAGSQVFGNSHPELKIHVPAGSLNAYKTATNWTSVSNKIVGDLEGGFEEGWLL